LAAAVPDAVQCLEWQGCSAALQQPVHEMLAVAELQPGWVQFLESLDRCCCLLLLLLLLPAAGLLREGTRIAAGRTHLLLAHALGHSWGPPTDLCRYHHHHHPIQAQLRVQQSAARHPPMNLLLLLLPVRQRLLGPCMVAVCCC
jgi:hypothetical protein